MTLRCTDPGASNPYFFIRVVYMKSRYPQIASQLQLLRLSNLCRGIRFSSSAAPSGCLSPLLQGLRLPPYWLRRMRVRSVAVGCGSLSLVGAPHCFRSVLCFAAAMLVAVSGGVVE